MLRGEMTTINLSKRTDCGSIAAHRYALPVVREIFPVPATSRDEISRAHQAEPPPRAPEGARRRGRRLGADLGPLSRLESVEQRHLSRKLAQPDLS
jgi:hypothetical protein